MRLALVGIAGVEAEPAWTGGHVQAEAAIRGFDGVSLLVEKGEATAAILTDVFGFEASGTEGTTTRYVAPGVSMGGIIDIRVAGGFLRGREGVGSVHHIAFRAADDAAQEAMVKKLREAHGQRVTEQRDRNYFRSVYFREPGGILFEIATDVPGFAVDEPVATLGEALKLPSGLEPMRARIEAVLPALS